MESGIFVFGNDRVGGIQYTQFMKSVALKMRNEKREIATTIL